MPQIHRFSLVYDADQDRIGWDTEDVGGRTMRLWLTQRLSKGLVNAIVPLLTPQTPHDVAAPHAATLQSWEQAAAMADFGKVPSVQTSGEPSSALINSMQIQPTEDGLNLSLDYRGPEPLTISLASAAVRQTLTVIYRLYLAAGWAMDIWPAWITDPETTAPAAAPKAAIN